jgi:hypothetical protein
MVPKREVAVYQNPWQATPAPEDAKFDEVLAIYSDGRIALNENQLGQLLWSIRGTCDGKIDFINGSILLTDKSGEHAEMKLNWDLKSDGRGVRGMNDYTMPKLLSTWLGRYGELDVNVLANPRYYEYKYPNLNDRKQHELKEKSALLVWGFLGTDPERSPSNPPGSIWYAIRFNEKTKEYTGAYFAYTKPKGRVVVECTKR